MKSKPILFALGVLLVLVGGYNLYKQQQETPNSTNNEKINIDYTTKRPDLSAGTFVFENESITLEDGRAETNLPGVDGKIETVLTDKLAYGELNGDNKEDAAALFIQEGGGSGTFVYLGAYVSGTVRYNGSNTIFLGDRISPQFITIDNQVITVNYLDRKEDEALAATPSVSVKRNFIYISGELRELK